MGHGPLASFGSGRAYPHPRPRRQARAPRGLYAWGPARRGRRTGRAGGLLVVGVDDVLGLVGGVAHRVLDLATGLVDLALALEGVVAGQRASRFLDPALGVVACSVSHVGLLPVGHPTSPWRIVFSVTTRGSTNCSK